MGLDGFSISDLRMRKEPTSAQYANTVERHVNEGADVKIKDVGEMSKDGEIRRKEENDENKKNKNKKQENFEDFFEDTTGQSSDAELIDTEKEEDFVDPFKDKNIRDFAVRINSKTEMIELYNKIDKKVIETITAEELMQLISKMKSASGILVNKKI
jgi:uncharacterized FlaG/YvyC family protein